MKSKYQIALVGVGKAEKNGGLDGCKIGYQHAQNLAKFERAELVAGVDIHPGNLEAWQQKFRIPQGFFDYDTMLRELRPDAVCIATYVGSHYPLIEKAARAGVRGILCEKPFLNSPAEMTKLRTLIAETGVHIVVNHLRRHQPLFLLARHLIDTGRLGKMELMSAGIDGWDLSEWGAHWLDLFRFLNRDAPIAWVFGQARTRDKRSFGHCMEEHAMAYFHFTNGCRALLDGGSHLGTAAMTLTGSEGSLRVLNEGEMILQTATGWEKITAESYGLPVWLGPWNALFDWMEGGDEPDLGATNQLLTSELNLAAYLSALAGDRMDLPLQSEIDQWPVDCLAAKSPHSLTDQI